jgi:hypothetical protein
MPKRIAIILVCCGSIAACGSSGKPNGSGAGGDPLRFSQCMRAHGVPNFPDPVSGGRGHGFVIKQTSGVNPSSPAFQSAQASCFKLLPGGGPTPAHATAQAKSQLLRVSECMRAHGVSGFPDPTTSPPTSPLGYRAVVGQGGAFLAIPNMINPQSPAFRQAAAACRFPAP